MLTAAPAEFVDPHPALGNHFGDSVTVLTNGNVVITSPYDDFGATDAGAVYLFDGQTGVLISTLRGSHANDHIGSSGVVALSNGNFVISSEDWDDGTIVDAGAATFANGTTGISGSISASNSLIGAHAGDQVSRRGIEALPNGNYVVMSPSWDNGAVKNAGAVTFGSGTSGVKGVVTTANSLYGTQADNFVGNLGCVVLSNGNFVVVSSSWANGSISGAGAVTFVSGTSGLVGAVSASNSLVGSHPDDSVGGLGFDANVLALNNGNYVVVAPSWDNGTLSNAGAVTFGNGTTGVTGAVTPQNSLVGTHAGDAVGGDYLGNELAYGGVTALTNGNYVVASPGWTNGSAVAAGAVTLVNGVIGLAGPVSTTNSLVGTHEYDLVGGALENDTGRINGITALTNGNYVVSSPLWDNGSAADVGAATFGNGNTGVKGTINATNSLIGPRAGDMLGGYLSIPGLDDGPPLRVFGGVTALTNGNYVVASPFWSNGGIHGAGAVTLGNGATGTTGTVTSTNSLIGSHDFDFVGGTVMINGTIHNSVTPLTNGNFVVASPFWKNSVDVVGAVTFGSGTSGITGTVTAANSLVGTRAGDAVGVGGVVPLTTGNYVVSSPVWNNPSLGPVGAVTRGSGLTGISGEVSSANSLVGILPNEQIANGGDIVALTNGNYVITSPLWDQKSGAATFGNGNVGVNGASITQINSLIGIHVDEVGSGGIIPLSTGNYLVMSPKYDGSVADSGAVSFGNGMTGLTSAITTANSVFGNTTPGTFDKPAFVVTDDAHAAFFVSFSVDGSGHVYRGSTDTGFNLPPAGLTLSANTVPEQQPVGRTVGTLSATDPNAGSSLTFTLVSGPGSTDNSSFTINSSNRLKTNAVFDFNAKNTYSIRVRVTDSGGLFTEQVFTINVTGVNQAPTDILLSPNTVGEHQPFGVIGHLSTIDPDPGNTFTYILNNDFGNPDNSHFVVQEDGTVLGGGYDFKSKSSYTISVYSVDQDGLFVSKDVTINITDLPFVPTDIELSSNSVAEKKPAGAIVGKLTTIDTDSSSNFIYTLGTGGDNAAFTIDAQGFLRTATILDTAVKNSYTISITSKDESNLSRTESFTISVTPVPAGGATELIDPNAFAENQFGSTVTVLPNGNVVVTSVYDDKGGIDAGAVYLYNGQTGALISSLTGSHVNDRVGLDGIIVLANGNFLVRSSLWNLVGAVTFVNGTTGLNGAVSVSNSLVGSSNSDQIGSSGVVALSNGNYVVSSSEWNNGALNNAGAVTFGNGTTGISGAITSSNSLVGTIANDFVGGGGVTALTNGNYVVVTSGWDNGAIVNAGAVTFGNGTTGITGNISTSNSLVGSQTNDFVGRRLSGNGVTALSNGNYVVVSSSWDNGPTSNAGAVTFGNGTSGTVGAVSSSNSLVGSHATDQVGAGGITLLSNGNYVVISTDWDNGTTVNAGAVTFGNRTTGVTGSISSSNSLVGTQSNDLIGSGGVTPLSNGNYVVASPFWNAGGVVDAGAVTWGNGTTGVSGNVSATNSLIGSQANDTVGNVSVTALTNGNFVVRSTIWDNGAVIDAGAATFVNGTTGLTGAVTAVNSLVGSHNSDNVGSGGVKALTNGNYVVSSYYWDNGAVVNAGAATFGNGTTGINGTITTSNSLVGTQAEDNISSFGITALSNGNYVVASPSWDRGGIADAGAVTFGLGTTGIAGAVSQGNSLVGGQMFDSIGSSGVTALANGNYVVSSSSWDNGSVLEAGAVTFGNGTSGSTGVVSTTNSLVGDQENQYVGNSAVTPLGNGSYLVFSYHYDDVSEVDPQAAVAVSYGSSAAGVTGTVSFLSNVLALSPNVSSPLPFVVTDNPHSAFYVSIYSEGSGHVYVGSTTSGLFKSPPTSIDLSANQISELSVVGTSVGTFSTIDPDSGNTFTYTLVSGAGSDDNAKFSITANGGLQTAGTFDYETKAFASIRVRSTDQSGLFTEQIFIINLTDQNEAPTALSLTNSFVAENQAALATVGSFNTTDPDSGNTFSYTLVTGSGSTDNGSFTIDGNGQLKTASSFNFEAKNSYSIRVRVTDQGGLTFETPLTVTVTNVNEPPTNLSLSANSIGENNADNATVGTLSALDPDANSTFTFSLVAGDGGNDNARFDISNNLLTINSAADFETQSSYSIRIRATDQGGLSFEKTLTIGVTNANEAPTDLALSANSIAEDNAPNATVGTLSAIDEDAGATFTYSLVSGTGSTDNAAFSIVGNTLKITPTTNFDTQNTYFIRVRAADQGGLSVEKALTINVTKVNQAPTDLLLSTSSIAENNAANAAVGTLSTVDSDSGNTFTYTLVSGTGSLDNPSFAISGNTLTATSITNFESKSSYQLRIRVTDQGGLSFEKPFTITVTDINETPSDVSLSATSIAENNSANATVGTLSGVDEDAGTTFTYSLVSGTGSTDNSSFSVANNVLKIIPSADFETQSSYSIRVRATDQGGLSFEKALTITVTPVNQAPTGLSLSGDSIAENNAANATVGLLSAIDPNSGDTLTFSLIAGTGSSDNGSFSISNNTLQVIPSTNFEDKASYSIRVRVTDQEGLTFEKPLTVTVVDVNEAPTDLVLSSSTIAENNAANATVGMLNAVDPDSGNTFTYSLVAGAGDTDNSSFAVSNNILRIIPSTDFETKSSYAIRIQVTDQDGLIFQKTLTISVSDVTEIVAPTLNSAEVPVVSNKLQRTVTVLPQIVVGGTSLGGGMLTIRLNSPGKKKPSDTLTFPATLGAIPAPTKSGGQFVWQFQLSPNVTAATLQAFLQGLTFSTKGAGLRLPSRSLQVSLTNSAAQPANFSQTITVIRK